MIGESRILFNFELGVIWSACYASSGRTYKPFNPLQGETFEWDRTADMGWRYIAEQVSWQNFLLIRGSLDS
jgi:hypothetical protein